jgi:hypothetical protein
VPLPLIGGPQEATLRADLDRSGIAVRHDVVEVPPLGIIEEFARIGLELTSMGRPAAADPALFEAAAVAGRVALTQGLLDA